MCSLFAFINIFFYLHKRVCYLFILLVDDLGLLVPLEPHHVLGMEAPALLLERLGGEVLRLRALHVVEYEEQRLRGQALEEVHRVRVRQHHLNITRSLYYLLALTEKTRKI